MLLEVHQPIGHGEVVDVEQLAMALERGRIFAVRVDHDDVPLGRHVADAVHDEGGRGRFAGAGGAEQCEVLAEQCVDIKRAAYRSEEHTSELQSLMRISYAVFCLKKNKI